MMEVSHSESYTGRFKLQDEALTFKGSKRLGEMFPDDYLADQKSELQLERQISLHNFTPPHSNPVTPCNPRNETTKGLLLAEIENLNLKIEQLTFELTANEKIYLSKNREIDNEKKALKKELEQWETKFEDRVKDVSVPPKTSKDRGGVILFQRIDQLEDELRLAHLAVKRLEKRYEHVQNENQRFKRQVEVIPSLMKCIKDLEQTAEERQNIIAEMQEQLGCLNSRLEEEQIVGYNDLVLVNSDDISGRNLMNTNTLYDELEGGLQTCNFAAQLCREKTWYTSWSVLWGNYLYYFGLAVCSALKKGPVEVVRRISRKKVSGNPDF